MSNAEADNQIVTLRMNIDQIDDLDQRLAALAMSGPGPESAAQRDSASEIGSTVWDLSITSLGVGIDHLATWRAILAGADRTGGRVPVYTHFTLLRAAAESAVVARWLCDPTVDDDERVGRGLGARLADQEERRKLEAVWRPPMATTKGESGTESDAPGEGAALPSIVPRPIPKMTDLFAAYAAPPSPLFRVGNGEAFFRTLSGIAHGKPWALAALTDDVEASLGDGWRERTIDVRSASWASFAAVVALDQAISDVERYASAGDSTPRD